MKHILVNHKCISESNGDPALAAVAPRQALAVCELLIPCAIAQHRAVSAFFLLHTGQLKPENNEYLRAASGKVPARMANSARDAGPTTKVCDLISERRQSLRSAVGRPGMWGRAAPCPAGWQELLTL